MAEPGVLSLVLAGGEGERLAPLTTDRAKPAVPFAGHYRLIDFVLSNLANAGYLKIVVLTQYKSHSLDVHISRTWRLSALLDSFVTPVPAQMRRGPRWFAGSADAIYQNLRLVEDERPEYICVFGADHIYRMDPRQMVQQHVDTGAGVTVAGIKVPIAEASQAGVIQPGSGTTVGGFLEKPDDPDGLEDEPDKVFASMGNYVFTTSTLVEAVTADADDDDSDHDMGGDILPMLTEAGEAHLYDFSANEVPGTTERDHGYWRDVGTLDTYHESHMDLLAAQPAFNLHNRSWPIYTWLQPLPPAKFLSAGDDGVGNVVSSMVCEGVVVHDARVRKTILSPGVEVLDEAEIERSVLMHDVVVGRGAVIRNAIIDKGVEVPPGAKIGVDEQADGERFTVSDNGIVVIGKGEKVPPSD